MFDFSTFDGSAICLNREGSLIVMQDFNQLGPWLTTGFSFQISSFARELFHPVGSSPESVLNILWYPGKIDRKITQVESSQVELRLTHMFDSAAEHSNRPPAGPEEISARREKLLSDFKIAYQAAIAVYEFEFLDGSYFLTEWTFAFLFLGEERSWVIYAEAIWQ